MSEFIKFLSRLIDRLNLDISIADVQKKAKDEYELAANILGDFDVFASCSLSSPRPATAGLKSSH